MIAHYRLPITLCGVILVAGLLPGPALRADSGQPAASQTRAATQAPPTLDATVARVMKTFNVPGIGLAIVKDGAVVVAKGYGVRKLGDPAAVDARTLFGIASNTKAFTATALGLLVEEGKVEWDAPVIRYVPWFQMWDPYVTRELTVRDLLVHRSGLGLGAGDLLWWPSSTYDRKEIARRLRFVQPATSFRSAYAYDNVLYLMAGEVIEAVSGQSWEDFVASRILKPAGMTGAYVRLSDMTRTANVAAPHAPIDGTVRPIAMFDSDNTNPAGGISAGAEDMAKWMIVQLNEGRLSNGARLFSDRTSRELTTLVTPMPIADPPAELAALRTNFRGYALGFNVQDYRGRKAVTHTGGLPGYVSKLTLIPELELGVMVMTNQESGEAFSALSWQIVDHYLDAPATDWIQAYDVVRARREAGFAEAQKRSAAARDAASTPSLPLAKYAGAYADAWYGDIEIRHENGKLTMRFTHTPSLIGDLEPWQHDTFVVKWRDRELRADAYVTFALDPDGNVAEAKMRAVSPATDFSFDFQDLLLKPSKTATTSTR
jgi:CubicO group peptidase (beta-lactamase class C family)